MLYVNDPSLTKQECDVRDEMVYLFNPALKFSFMQLGMSRFKQYGFNSCRQTAILGATYLRKIMPSYTHQAYEGDFVDYDSMGPVPYAHAFIISSQGNRHILIDISRTSRKLLFQRVQPKEIYSTKIEGCENTMLYNIRPIDVDAGINMKDPEYLTNLRPLELFDMVCAMIERLKQYPKEERERFWKSIYSQVTYLNIGGELF